MIKVGDNVEHTKSKIQGRVVAVLNRIFVEVEVDNDIYYWDQRNLKILSGENDRDDWDDDFGYWNQNYSFKFADPVKEEDIKCICSSYDLFHFGCKCSAFELEQRRSRSLKGDE